MTAEKSTNACEERLSSEGIVALVRYCVLLWVLSAVAFDMIPLNSNRIPASPLW